MKLRFAAAACAWACGLALLAGCSNSPPSPPQPVTETPKTKVVGTEKGQVLEAPPPPGGRKPG
jgi:hypothetical protein